MKRVLFTLSVLLLLLVACGQDVNLDEPPEIIYGETECDRCGMLINDARYAAAYMTTDGEARFFDDIGGMLIHHAENHEDVHLFWVHDRESKVWVKANEAVYVMGKELMTPMGFGIAAHNSREEADALAEETGGMIMEFDDLMAKAEAGELMPDMQMHGHDHDN